MDLSKDERFSKVSKDPRFWEMPVKEQKIKIDKRFKAMFHEKRFKLKYMVDKRGRPFNHSSGEDLKKFYKLSDEDEEDGDVLNEDRLPQITDDRTKRVTSTQRPTGRVGSFKNNDVERKSEKHCSKLKKKRNEVKSKQEADKQTTDKDEVKKNDVRKQFLAKKRERDFETSDSVCCSKGKTQTFGKSKEQIVSLMKPPQPRRVPLKSGSEDDHLPHEPNEFEKRCKDDVDRIEEEGDDLEGDEGNLGEIEEDLDDDESGSETEEEEAIDHCGPDLARGGGELESSSDEEEFFELFENEPETVEHAWGELANDARRGDTVTRRLALCNMDWDRIKAKDLLLLFDSFKPKGGVIFSVKVLDCLCICLGRLPLASVGINQHEYQ
uniref:ESF1 homolog n=1 Tax=Myxine glutinosa TaxID=7769 RepID=UPI00358FE7AB